MLQRPITSTTTTLVRNPAGYTLTILTKFVESSIGGGSMRDHTDVYEALSRDELRDVMEHLADAPIAGEEFRGAGLQLSLI